jgi:hypothetical protein
MACVITFNNKKYSYEEFASMLHDGELNKMISDGLVDESKLSGDMSVLSEVKQEPEKEIASQAAPLKGEEEERTRDERSKFEYFKKETDKLDNSKYTAEEITEIIKNGDFTVLTGENPMGEVYTDSYNESANKKAEEFLKVSTDRLSTVSLFLE